MTENRKRKEAPDSLPKIRVGGVPEHFNLPWHLAIENGTFRSLGVDVEWHEYKLGTGAMISAVKAGEVDVVIALTEGLIADIAKGSDIRLLGTYVASPLCWAISTGASSPYKCVEQLRHHSMGVSRLQSGSHLMSCVLASQRGWKQDELTYKIEGTFEQLRASVNASRTAAFMWESFTTKPYHDSGEIARIGEIVTPWPCFLMASTLQTIDKLREPLKIMCQGIQQSCAKFHQDKSMYETVAARYGLRVEDAQAWYKQVRLSGATSIAESTFQTTLHALVTAGVLPAKCEEMKYSEFIDSSVDVEIDIKSMKLYSRPELLTSLYNNMRAVHKETGPLTYTDLLPFDQNHYNGTAALDTCASLCELRAQHSVLNIGSSVGGPARYLAATQHVEVLGIELQSDLYSTAIELTERCQLKGVNFICANILQIAQYLNQSHYNAIVSWLTLLHFTEQERLSLFQLSHKLLADGGYFYSEDFIEVAGKRLTVDEKLTLKRDVFTKHVSSIDSYATDLRSAGFEVVSVHDLTVEWRHATSVRARDFHAQRERHVQVHGQELFERLAYFYDQVAKLFENGNLGGVRILARKPKSA